LRFRFPEVCAAMFAAHKKGNLKGSQGGKVWGKQSPWPKGQKRDGDKAAESRQSICNNNKLFTARELASKQALTFRGGHEHEHGLGKWTWSCGHGRKDVQGDMQFPFCFSPPFGPFHFLEDVAEVAPAGVAFPQLDKKLDAIFMNEKRFPRAKA